MEVGIFVDEGVMVGTAVVAVIEGVAVRTIDTVVVGAEVVVTI